MPINVIVTDGTTGGISTNVVKVITQTTIDNGATVNTQANKGFILTSSSLQTINLPDNPSVGDVIALHGEGTGLFRVVQRAGEQIILGDKQTTVGISGFIESTNSKDELYLLCIDSAGIWKNDGGFGGVFSIDGTTTNNTINDTVSGGSNIGFVKMENNLWTGRAFSFTSSFLELAPTSAVYISKLSSNFTNPSNARLIYIGADTKMFLITGSFTASAGDNFAIALAVNGVVDVDSESYSESERDVFFQNALTLSTNDEISIFVRRSSNGNRDITSLGLSIMA